MEKHSQVHHEPAHTPHKTKKDQVEHNLTYHAPRPEQQILYEKIRNAAKALAITILETTPDSPEQDTALTELYSCVMFANASIARS